jgi:hypothetical protein
MENYRIKLMGVACQIKDIYRSIFYIIIIIAAMIICKIFSKNESNYLFTLSGSLIGIFSNFIFTCASVMQVKKDDENKVYSMLYSKWNTSKAEKHISFYPKRHRFFRFDSENVVISKCDKGFYIFGQYCVLKKIKNILQESHVVF